MYLSALHLQNFRSYAKQSWKFVPGINHIIGGNAKGKTTILEAIHFLICGSSFRAQQHFDMIRRGEPYFFLEAEFVKHGITQKLKVACSPEQKKIVFNNTPLYSLSNLFGHIHGTIFTPDDATLVKGTPAARRQFLDLQLGQVDPLYIHYLTRFHKAMRQRNCLLRARSDAAIEGWEEEMANAALYLWSKRSEAVETLGKGCEPLYSALSGGNDTFALKYKSTYHTKTNFNKEAYCKLLRENRRREKELGFTTVGPHKDDLFFTIDEADMRYFGSEGQQRTSVAVLRLLEWNLLESLSGIRPLMLVDDVGLSLDGVRKQKMCRYLKGLGQVFLTSTEELDEIEMTEKDQLIVL